MIRFRVKLDNISLKVGADDAEYSAQALDRISVEDMLAVFRDEYKMCFEIECDMPSGSDIHLTNLL